MMVRVHICFNRHCWALTLLHAYRRWRLEAFTIPFRWMGLWFKQDRSIMTEFQCCYLIKTYRILIQCTVLAILFSVLGNNFDSLIVAAKLKLPASCLKYGSMIVEKWELSPFCLKYWSEIIEKLELPPFCVKYWSVIVEKCKRSPIWLKYGSVIVAKWPISFQSVSITVPGVCKLIAFFISLPFLLVGGSYDLIRFNKKRRLVWVTSIIMSIISVHPQHQRYRDTYLLALLLISCLSVQFGTDTYEKLQFLPRILLASLFLLFASGTVFVALIGYVAPTQFLIHACVMASCQVLLADFMMGTFRLDVFNIFVQVLMVILITEMV